MPLFLINARDKADSLALRMETRSAHLDWARGHADKIAMAGPVIAADGETMAGSTFVISFETLQAAQDWAASDPYAKAGLLEAVEVIEFKWTLGEGKPAS